MLLFTNFRTLIVALVIATATTANALPVERGVDDIINGLFNGFVTFFHPKTEGGEIGACGPKEDDNSRICALNIHQFGKTSKSKWCNKKVQLKRGKKTTICTITDSCPGCKQYSIDATPAVFRDLGDENEGVISVTWQVI
ncbi:hypothetical protein EC973_000112 [Apophysomyces ossiformis]|uniref:RlpA-like protein double-psi beta-barrel domain-containing protein n=1 Tax=Apophysomyces ossiformis TaxID=679940 RepID=A0A8H7EUQ7_9FUNG|nr:hypothetical protein EC973_000112 [Apophysomyces ossiformis]